MATWKSLPFPPDCGVTTLNRRNFLKHTTQAAGLLGLGVLSGTLLANGRVDEVKTFQLGDAQTAFLKDLRRRCYSFFIDTADPVTGLVPDRAAFNQSGQSSYSSAASCGFALASYSSAARSGWADADHAHAATLRMLKSLNTIAAHERGFLYHFFDCATGQRSPQSEASSIDTALLLAGAMVAATTFADDKEIVDLVNKLCDRVDWNWMLNGGSQFSMGWTPEHGFIDSRWDRYSELTLLVLIAIGARTNSVPADCWNAWRRGDVLEYKGESFLSYPPLFVHQYPHAFFDFREFRSPSGRSYWDNSVVAHLAQIDFMTELSRRYPSQMGHYGENLWGLTSSDSELGYRDWGGPYRQGQFEPERGIDGTIVPSAAAGGLPMVPEQALRTLMYQKDTFKECVYGRFGFINAYNPRTKWFGSDVIGIDTGITLLMTENLLNGSIWKQFMQHDIAVRGFEASGFKQA